MEKEICDNGAFTNWGSRDINCALDVARMEKMGKFPITKKSCMNIFRIASMRAVILR